MLELLYKKYLVASRLVQYLSLKISKQIKEATKALPTLLVDFAFIAKLVRKMMNLTWLPMRQGACESFSTL